MHLFITGAYRSGTTLVEKLLHQRADCVLAAQPFPNLYLHVKKAFLGELGLGGAHPLGHGFRSEYRFDDWLDFLERRCFDATDVDQWIAEQVDYSGALTPQIERLRGRLGGGRFLEIHERLQVCLSGLFSSTPPRVTGSKEILCEEYLPALLDAGHRVVLVVRDVRAVLSSLLGTGGARYGGAPRPVLFTVRVWRKSVAYALAWADHPGLHVVRYEDLLTDRTKVMGGLAAWLDLPADSRWLASPILDQQGRLWTNNSSFSEPGIGPGEQEMRYRSTVPPATLRYVETCAYPELKALGYAVRSAPGPVEACPEPTPMTRPEFDPFYSSSTIHLGEERRRLELAQQGLEPAQAEEWFLFPLAHCRLRESLAREGSEGRMTTTSAAESQRSR